MIVFSNSQGLISISRDVVTDIVGYTVTNCFGVVGMASHNHADSFVSLFKKDNIAHGIKIRADNKSLLIDIHIVMRYGVNIKVICQSIIGKVQYTLEKIVGVKIKQINVFVDSIKQELDF